MPANAVRSAGREVQGQVVKAGDYDDLVRKVRAEFDDMEDVLRRRMVEGFHRVGQYIDQHLSHIRKRIDHREDFYERLAADVGRDRSTLMRAHQFYRAYPKVATWRLLSWGHYKGLITIRDGEERKKVEQMVIRNNWNIRDFRGYLRSRRVLEAVQDEDKPVPQLKVTRGRLNVYKVAVTGARGKEEALIDYGFGVLRPFSGNETKGLNDGDLIEREAGRYVATDIADQLRYTYKAYVERVVDGDTLLVLIEGGGGNLVRDRLRLRGIDCPELDTEEGKRAKRFVEQKLGACPFIVIRTYKERKDLHARYLADVFYLPDRTDAAKVAAEGIFLNQELLDERLAVAYL